MKRYYVQVIDAESEKQLAEAGINPKHILSVEDENLDATKHRILDAIYKVTGISYPTIRGRASGRYAVSARIMYVYFCALAGYSKGSVCEDLKRSPRYVRYYLDMVKARYDGDKEFQRDIEAVEDLLHLTKRSTASKIIFYESGARKIRKKKKK